MPDGNILTATTAQTVKIITGVVSANEIQVSYATPNGNQPNAYGNNVYIWQSGNQIPWSSDALNSQAIQVNTPSGDVFFDGLDVTNLSYIIGYAVGPTASGGWTKYPNVVASVYVPAIGDSGDTSSESFAPSVAVVSPGSTSVGAKISMLEGFKPASSDTYVGIWEGDTVSYTQLPKWREKATSDNSNSTVSFNNVELLRGTTYTLGLFSTGFADQDSNLNQKTLTATSSFTI